MQRTVTFISSVLLTLISNVSSYAQKGNNLYDFVPVGKVIFKDDFSHDTIGAFPSYWHFSMCNKNLEPDHSDKKFWTVGKEGNEHLLMIENSDGYLDPNIGTKKYLRDSFAIDFDFRFYIFESGCAELCFYTYEKQDPCMKACIHIVKSGEISEYDFLTNNRSIVLGQYPDTFAPYAWHHFALAYKEKAIDLYIDKYRVVSIPDCGFTPIGVSLGCIAPVGYKHFRITTGMEANSFTKLLTEKKFVTHAINFDVNKSTIKSESMDFIRQLAQFLKANPSIRLEIDGHTDNDGDATTNMKLSQKRADEVKKQLVSAGIDTKRLTVKGFGASKLLQPDTSPEAKANNRRVEFIKL